MKEKFISILDDIKKDLIFLANEVEHNIRQSIKALKKHDLQLAEQVILKDKQVDEFEVKIEENILELLALQQPVAIDLRFIIGGLKMNNDLERIGDHAGNIASAVIELKSTNLDSKLLTKLNDMKKISCTMLHDVVSSFIHQDADDARDVCERDNDVDKLYDEILAETKEMLKKDSSKMDQAFAIVRIARSLERVGDLSTNIAEDVVFMKDAKIIRHGG